MMESFYGELFLICKLIVLWSLDFAQGYYQRVRQYFTVLYRHRGGLFEVPMVHTALLINMRHHVSKKLAYDPAPPGYEGPYDDIIRFAFSAKAAGTDVGVEEDFFKGYLSIQKN